MKKTNLLILLYFITFNLFAWEGNGTSTNPYKISSPQDLIDLSNSTESYEGIYFQQTQDIDMQECQDFQAIGTKNSGFKGFYDGQNFKIKNLKVSKGYPPGMGGGETNVGLFGDVIGGVIENVHITGDSRFEAYKLIGSIVGECANTIVRNCTSSAVIVADAGEVGGIVGKGGKIYNCNFTGSITAEGNYSSYIGGIVGSISGTGEIENCNNSGTIVGNGYVGGVSGYLQVDGVIRNCFNKGSVTSTSDYVGGIVGYVPIGLTSSAVLERCHNAGAVKGTKYVGGVAGYSVVTIKVAGNTGNIEATDAFVGGIAGNGSVVNSYNKGVITGTEKVGGIIGSLSGTLGKLDNCYNTGAVSGTNNIGGLVGAIDGNSCPVSNSYSTGNVSATEQNVGGIVGYVNLGGLINSNEIANTYWNSDVYAGKGVGNLTGPDEDFEYYPKTTAELKNNFSVILGVADWKEDDENINNGYPILRDEIYGNSVKDYPSVLSNVKVYSFGNQIYISNDTEAVIKQVEIFDITGRSIYKNIPTQNAISLDVSAGIYIVRLFTGSEAKGYKVMLTK